ncbi:MAG: hypothetical protein RBR53_04465 [Desulforegulaceae bacterium]|nr:hypothetical protein [Desulforegulaceae bacterium]
MNMYLNVDLIQDNDWAEIMKLQNKAYDTIEPETSEVLGLKNKVSKKPVLFLNIKKSLQDIFYRFLILNLKHHQWLSLK